MKPEWFQDWSGEACAVVASGPSVTRDAVESFRGRCRVVVVNNGYLLAPWADVLYAADGRWWNVHQAARSFAGMKVTPDKPSSAKYGLNLVELVTAGEAEENKICLKSGTIGRGGNGGFQAMNLALQFGARRILLVGFDFSGEHWHGPHPAELRNPRPGTLERWAATLDAQAAELERIGADVVNASPVSVLRNFRKVKIEEALSEWTRQRAA